MRKEGIYTEQSKSSGTLQEVTHLFKGGIFSSSDALGMDSSCQKFWDVRINVFKTPPHPPFFNFVQGINYLIVIFLNVPL